MMYQAFLELGSWRQETTLFVQVERRRAQESGIDVTNHPLFSRRK